MTKGIKGFQKGHKKYVVRHTEETKRKISESRIGSKNYNWKGDKACLSSVHQWVRKHLPEPAFCEICKLVPPMDLANISQKYKRDFSDWEYLCRKCHMTKDGRIKKAKDFLKDYRRKNPRPCIWRTRKSTPS